MDRDNEEETVRRRDWEEVPPEAKSPSAAGSSHERVVRARKPSRQAIEANILKAPTTPLAPLKAPQAVLAKRVPSYPAWEKPPSPWIFPELRGREEHRPLRPILFAAVGVVVVLIAVVGIPWLLGHGGGGVASATGSRAPSASVSDGAVASGRSQAPSPSATATPAGPTVLISYQQYTVQPGDSITKIATRFHLHSWEILLANPQITNSNMLKVGAVINIPQPGQLTPPPAATPTPADNPSPADTPTPAAP